MVIAKEHERRVEVCEASRELAQHPFHHILPAKQVQEAGSRLSLTHTRNPATSRGKERGDSKGERALNAGDPKTYHDSVVPTSVPTSHQWVFQFKLAQIK